jgi:hypothetical protein
VVIVAINKRPDADLSTTIRVGGLAPAGGSAPLRGAHAYRFGQDDSSAIRDLGEVPADGQELSLTLPAYSITLLRLATG